jgi:hypothetical protein
MLCILQNGFNGKVIDSKGPYKCENSISKPFISEENYRGLRVPATFRGLGRQSKENQDS